MSTSKFKSLWAHEQLILHVIGVVFVNIEDNELFGVEQGDLPAQLRANGTAAAGNQARFSLPDSRLISSTLSCTSSRPSKSRMSMSRMG